MPDRPNFFLLLELDSAVDDWPAIELHIQERRRACPERLKKRCLIRLGGLEMARLNVTKTADFFRDGSEANSNGMVNRIEVRQYFIEHRLVFADEPALGFALF